MKDHKNSTTATLTHTRNIANMPKNLAKKGMLPLLPKRHPTTPAKKGSLPLLPRKACLPLEEHEGEDMRKKKRGSIRCLIVISMRVSSIFSSSTQSEQPGRYGHIYTTTTWSGAMTFEGEDRPTPFFGDCLE